MDYDFLQIFVPAFMITYLGFLSVWAHVRKTKTIRFVASSDKKYLRRIRLVDKFFKLLMMSSICIAGIYAFFTEYYFVTGPITALDNPIINIIGILILKMSLVWIVVAQFHIERTIALINSDIEEVSFNRLVYYSQKLIHTGMLIMFFGLFVTISNVIGIIICVVAAIAFDRLLSSKESWSQR